MSTSTWRESEPGPNEPYPLALLKKLLKQMLLQFSAQGGCIALYDENVSQMRIYVHLRQSHLKSSRFSGANSSSDYFKPTGRRVTIKLLQDIHPSSPSADLPSQNGTDFIDVDPQYNELLTLGSTYPMGHDLIGFAWHNNEAFAMRHDDYLKLFYAGHQPPVQTDIMPQAYLVVPIHDASPNNEPSSQPPQISGIIVLYQLTNSGHHFPKQRKDALIFADYISLNLQNDRLQRSQRRTNEYLRLLQGISSTFPSSVKVSELVENMHSFVVHMVDVSSLLLTIYDRDLDRIYDIFAINNGQRVEHIIDHPHTMRKEARPIWWKTTQQEKCTLLFSPTNDPSQAHEYEELLTGTWGDQHLAASFLLLPMKMFNRVIGSLCLTSLQPHAYQPEEIQVLETMTQFVTVGIENAKLYERDRRLLHEARQREAQLAAMNSALQSISSMLNVTELLNNLVESVASLVKVEMCAFFQPSPTGDQLVALALYGLSSVRMVDDGSGMPIFQPPKQAEHNQLINQIRLPFRGTLLEQMVHEGFFYLQPTQLEELAQESSEGGAIFLLETNIHSMLMIPLSYQSDFIGFLAVPIPNGNRLFRPKDVGTLLAISAQAASALRNAQLFEQRTEAYAELERMNKLKDEFLVTASHELRTPLTAISGYSSQLKRQGARANPQQILRFATKIHVAAQQLTDLVANMTEAAQMGSVDKRLQIEPVQLLAAAEIAINMLTLSSEQNVTLTISPDTWVNGDAPRVRQVLTNLLENASKYAPPESPIHVSATSLSLSQIQPLLSEDQVDPTQLLEQEDRPLVLVRVTDKGEGIQTADRLKIFDKFVRAPRSLTTSVRGTGLGLYICRRFVETMGGKLWLEHSVPNEGSTFSFYLPQVAPPVEVRE